MQKPITGIAHCGFRTTKFEEMLQFYGEILEVPRHFDLPYTAERLAAMGETPFQPGDVWITEFRVGERQFLEIFNVPYTQKEAGKAVSFAEISLEVEDIEEAARKLEAKGVTLWDGSRDTGKPIVGPYQKTLLPGGFYGFHVQDPEGNEVQLIQYETTN